MADRIVKESVPVRYQDIQTFFDERSARDGVKSKYNYVLFQDDHPELAEQRDAWEKEKIAPFLNVAQGKKTLDLGCGIGRWGEFFLPQGVRYVGMDGSAGMVRRGEENLKEYADKHLFQGYLQDFPTRLSEEGEEGLFDNILVNGVFMYLNDVDFHASLTNLLRYAAPSCTIYLKESMGTEERLTLRQVHSEALNQEYSAVYRSVVEYTKAFSKVLSPGCELLASGPLFAQGHNRKETLDYFFVYRYNG
mgnify:FL=1